MNAALQRGNVGVVNLLYGAASGIDAAGNSQFTQAGSGAGATEAGDRFGAALGAGDFNLSRSDDLTAGAPDEDVGSAADAGAFSILYGGTSGIDATGNAIITQAATGKDPDEAGDASASPSAE